MRIDINLDSFRELYDLYYTPLCDYLNLYTKDIQVIEDVIHDVFLKLWENKDSLDISYIKTYIFHSAKNQILNYLRNEANRSSLLEKWFQQQIEDRNATNNSFDTDKLFAVVLEAIDTLPPKCKELFLLSKIENKTYREIAVLKDLSIKTVENQMGIALKKIRDFLHSKYEYLMTLLLPILL